MAGGARAEILMSATTVLALAATLAAAAPGPLPCAGLRLPELEAQLSFGRHYHLEGAVLRGFVRLWAMSGSPAAGSAFDRAVVISAGGRVAVLLGRGDCAIGAVQTTPEALFEAMRGAVGPAV
jgi:hypothetical protein